MRRGLTGFIVVALMVTLATPVTGQDQPPEGAMLIILDASGSMNNLDEDGVPFIEKAKDAVGRLIDALPDGMWVGLRVYGHREPNTDPVAGCRDTELLVPVAPLDRDSIRSGMETIEASGFTPIGLSLQQAAEDLPDVGARSIVLISDGEDTCAPPDPCDVAAELYGDRFDVRIESIGFMIDTGSAAEQQLRCIAESTGGEYQTAGRADELVARLGEVASDVMEWRPVLTLDGSLDAASPATLPVSLVEDWLAQEPPTVARGEYVSLLMPGETRWFRVSTWNHESLWSFADLESPEDIDLAGEFEALIIDSSGNDVGVAPPGHDRSTSLPASDSPNVGVTLQEVSGLREADTFLLGFHWDAPREVLLAQVHFNVDLLADGDEGTRATLEGSLEPEDAPMIPLEELVENGPDWRGGAFLGPIAAGETRWYRMDNASREVNVFAEFPSNRVVGMGLEGEFGVVLTDVEGRPVGTAHFERPQMSQTFGGDTHQAMVSATVTSGAEAIPETVLIGLTWNGDEGESVFRFEVETFADSSQMNAPTDSDTTQPGAGEDVPRSVDIAETAQPEADEGVPAPVMVGAGVLAVALAAAYWVLRRRRKHTTGLGTQ